MVLALGALIAGAIVVLEALLIAIIVVIAILAILAIIRYYADDISAFVTEVYDDSIATATAVWDSLVHAEEWIEARVNTIEAELASRLKKRPNIYNVYNLHVIRPGLYNDYTRGEGYSPVIMLPKDIYKYGITSIGKVLGRYFAFAWYSVKERTILMNLLSKHLGAKEWEAQDLSYFRAKAIERTLLEIYVVTHLGKFPPGNTGYY